MNIAGIYSFKSGKEIIESQYALELQDIKEIVTSVNGNLHRTKTSREKTMPGRKLYSPASLNRAFKREFLARGDEMSTGVSYFEQFLWDLEHRGIADIDIPVLILGIVV